MTTTLASTRRLGRRQAFARLTGLSVLGLAFLTACKQPVPPTGAVLPPAKRSATPTSEPTKLLRLGLLYPGYTNGFPADRFFGALRVGGYAVGSTLSNSFANDPCRLWMAPDRIALVRDELVANPPDIIFAPSTAACELAHAATSTIPIVTISPDDLVAKGLVKALERPEGNVTGLTTLDPLRGPQALKFLARVVPSVSYLAVIWNPDEADRDAHATELIAAAQTIGVRADALPARNADEANDAVHRVVGQKIDAVISLGDPMTSPHQALIAGLALVYRLPVLFERKELVRGGGLLSFGPDVGRLWRRAGEYSVQIARGKQPGELPVTSDTSVEIAVNLQTARALGLMIPQSILGQSAEIIP